MKYLGIKVVNKTTMKQLISILFFIGLNSYSQDFSKVDNIVLNYPRFSKVENLSKRIEKDFSSDLEKARAAFFWLTQNIRYNLKEFYNPKQRSYSFRYSTEAEKEQKSQAIVDKLVAEAFANKIGVCEEYAQSFKKICDLLGIEAEVIKGYVRNDASEIGNVPNRTNHAWNAVKIDNKWLVIDATWAAGHEYNGRWVKEFNGYFFNMPKNKIFKTHYPDNKLWVLRFGRLEIEEFYNQPIYTNTFLGLDTELLSPLQGSIYVESSENIVLEFKSLDTSQLIFYTMRGFKYAQKPIITTVNGISKLVLKNPNRNTDLVLYINKNDALHFKVKVN